MESLHVRHESGLEMIIALDSTRRGPALGGCRWRPYEDSLSARRDAVALAEAMTRKAALARLSFGGGKAVVAGDPHRRTYEQLRHFGEFVDSLDGRYITAADMGTSEDAMVEISSSTRWVAGLPTTLGGPGDPAPFTARGLFLAIERALEHRERGVAGAHVCVEGVGHVGRALVDQLLVAGARVTASDLHPERLTALPTSVSTASPEGIGRIPCDVFAPCGPGGLLTHDRAEQLSCIVVCGAANNPLSEPRVASRLMRRDILYVPDYVANAGGLIHLAVALEGGDATITRDFLQVIPENVDAVIAQAKAEACDTAVAAERLAQSLLRRQ